jgi:hypothetical protein
MPETPPVVLLPLLSGLSGQDLENTFIKDIRPLLKQAYGWDIKGKEMKAHRAAAREIAERLLAQQTLRGRWLLWTVRTYM